MKEVIPCKQDAELRKRILVYAEVLKTQAHLLGDHGLDELDFYNSGLFRGAIERVRGQFSATISPKREFVRHVLNRMQDEGFIQDYEAAGDANRHDYIVGLNSGRKGVIELKGCLDGNNTNIFERPPQADEFLIWSLCTNPGGDPRHNVWSGINTRLSAEIVSLKQQVDGLIVWDMVCATLGRPCPKIALNPDRLTDLGQYRVPPPCIYVFPSSVPTPRQNPSPRPHALDSLELLSAFHRCFGGFDSEVNYVTIEATYAGNEIMRATRLERNGELVIQGLPNPIMRT
jgi:hypothetical protein